MGINFSSPIRVKEATANRREDMFAKVRPLVNARKQSGWLCGWTGRTAQEDDTRTSDELRSRAAVVITSAWYPASLIGPWVHPVASVPPFWFFSLSLFLSLSRASKRAYTRANVGRSESFLLRTSLSAFAVTHPRSLCFSLSRVIPLEAVVHK